MRIFKTDGTVAYEVDGHRTPYAMLDAMRASGLAIQGLRLDGMEFIGEEMRGWNLSECAIEHCRFDRCDMRGAVLNNVQLTRAGFENCQIGSMELLDTKIRGLWNHSSYGNPYGDMINVGTYDDFHLYAYRWMGQYFVVRAGCRHFTYERAVRHWEGVNGRQELLAGVQFAKIIAEHRGWKIEVDDSSEWERINEHS